MPDDKQMPDGKQMPYGDPDLREAYRHGWKARVQGRLRPERQRLGPGNWAKAWLEGYMAAEDAEEDGHPPPSLNDRNPYSGEEDRLQQAWEEGYRAGKQGEPLPKPGGEAYDDPETERACLEGYQVALKERSKD